MEFWTDLLLSPPIIIAALVIGTLGEVTKRIVLGSKKGRPKTLRMTVTPPAQKGDGAFRTSTPPSQVVQTAVPEAMWRRIYFVTLPAHPVIIGALLGFIPWLPPAEQLLKPGYELAARVGTYCLAGVVCKIGYDTMVSTVLRAIQARGIAAASAVGGSSSEAAEASTGEAEAASAEGTEETKASES